MRYKSEPVLQVGIVSASEISFKFETPYIIGEKRCVCESAGIVRITNEKIEYNNDFYDELTFIPLEKKISGFELMDVVIGKSFHWERKEIQSFEGSLKFIIEDNLITAINLVPLESYLLSVISSEMSAKASESLLKAHAVISRSWLLSQIEQKGKKTSGISGFVENENEHIKWYDREDHANFDVCADDHCQRYQGKSKAGTPQVKKAIAETKGQVLMFEDNICDARFSKCCGGMMEEFRYCWEDNDLQYLRAKCDDIGQEKFVDLRLEQNAVKWISNEPEAFCNTRDKNILEQVLNNYDQETTDFYRWSVKYGSHELSDLIYRKSGIDFGEIIDLEALERGKSGRIVKLKITGTKKTLIIGKELEIRKFLSESHLYSSAFVIEKKLNEFVLKGAGWGHGVGLCQIGAALMSTHGYDYKKILSHYYPESLVTEIY